MTEQTWLKQENFKSQEDFCSQLQIEAPEYFNFAFDVVDRIAANDPQRRALVWCDDHGAEHVFTMAEMATESLRAAKIFTELGIKRGDAVMLMLRRRYEYWFLLLGLCRIGAIAIPGTTQLTAKDVRYRVDAASVKMIVAVDEPSVLGAINEACSASTAPICALVATPDGQASANAQAPVEWLDFSALMRQSDAQLAAEHCVRQTGSADIMLLYFTSGTTGMPKMVRHNFLYPFGHLVTARYWQGCFLGGLHWTIAETGWAKAAWGKIYGQWMCGCAVMVYDMQRFHTDRVLQVIGKYGVTSFCAPPTMYRHFIKENLKAYNLTSLQRCVVAGEPLNPEVYQRFLQETGLKLYEAYGQTEVTVAVGTFPWMEPKPGSMGKAAPGYDLALMTPEGRVCEVGEEGQLVVRIDLARPLGMFDGYYRDAQLTQSVCKDGIYYTGDMAWCDEDGYYWFVGRADDVIKSSGYRIGPFEVESALIEHPAVLECAITGIPDETRGQLVKATIVLAPGFEPSETLAKELQQHVKGLTAPYKYPRVVEFVAELPKTISGKIRRVEIRAQNAQS